MDSVAAAPISSSNRTVSVGDTVLVQIDSSQRVYAPRHDDDDDDRWTQCVGVLLFSARGSFKLCRVDKQVVLVVLTEIRMRKYKPM